MAPVLDRYPVMLTCSNRFSWLFGYRVETFWLYDISVVMVVPVVLLDGDRVLLGYVTL